jgi:ElaB/YqjD/DUF883 family membrane-anchored ribosome-binding protein
LTSVKATSDAIGKLQTPPEKEPLMTDAAERMADDLAEGYQDVTRGLARMTKHLGADAGDAVAQSAAAFVRAACDLAEKMKKQSETLAKKAGEEIREHPIATAAVAAAAVGLLGYAITHTRHNKRDA